MVARDARADGLMPLVRIMAQGDCLVFSDEAGEPLGRVCLQRTLGKHARMVLILPDTTRARHEVAPSSDGARLPDVHTSEPAHSPIRRAE